MNTEFNKMQDRCPKHLTPAVRFVTMEKGYELSYYIFILISKLKNIKYTLLK